jgi:hypothetical protein
MHPSHASGAHPGGLRLAEGHHGGGHARQVRDRLLDRQAWQQSAKGARLGDPCSRCGVRAAPVPHRGAASPPALPAGPCCRGAARASARQPRHETRRRSTTQRACWLRGAAQQPPRLDLVDGRVDAVHFLPRSAGAHRTRQVAVRRSANPSHMQAASRLERVRERALMQLVGVLPNGVDQRAVHVCGAAWRRSAARCASMTARETTLRHCAAPKVTSSGGFAAAAAAKARPACAEGRERGGAPGVASAAAAFQPARTLLWGQHRSSARDSSAAMRAYW